MTKTKLLPLLTLTIIAGALFFAGATTAYASDSPEHAGSPETLVVESVWLTGDTLNISVTDKISGEKQTLALNLSEYAGSGDEYITVRATDSAGRVSNSIQFKNPYYSPQNSGQLTVDSENPQNPAEGSSQSAVRSELSTAFTPDGTGTVMDNAASGDGKEFFTVKTPDGSVFYLVVDRQRTADNVYLLNAVTEDDLMSLAKPGNGKSESVIPPASPPSATPAPMPEPTPTPAAAPEKSGGGSGTIAFVAIAVVIGGGAGYYFKIVRPKQTVTEDDYDDEAGDDAEMDFEDDEEGGDDD